jgi:hypothetical protein
MRAPPPTIAIGRCARRISSIVASSASASARVERRTDRFQHVLRDVDQNRAGPRPAREAKRGAQRLLEGGDVANADRALGGRTGDRGHVGFLERIGPHQRRPHLTRDRDERDRVHLRVEQSGNEVGRARTRGREAHADASGRPRVPAGGERRGLLVARQDVTDRVPVQLVVQRHDRSARISEDDVDAFIRQDVEDQLCAGRAGRVGHVREAP